MRIGNRDTPRPSMVDEEMGMPAKRELSMNPWLGHEDRGCAIGRVWGERCHACGPCSGAGGPRCAGLDRMPRRSLDHAEWLGLLLEYELVSGRALEDSTLAECRSLPKSWTSM